jgi:two-component system, cell cycle sensor histidine kinase and response regulator CckA
MDTGHERTLEAVARLAGGIAHDLNNALLPLRAYGEIALRKIGRGEDAAEEIQEMLEAAERASTLTRQLAAFSGTHVLRPDMVDLNELVADVESELASAVGDDVTIVTSLHREPVRVLADRGLLELVLVNLTLNAGAAMEPGGGTVTIAVAADRSPLGAELTVCDTGRGMDAETAAHVFEPFFTAGGESRGRGLGLASAHGIVKQSGGTIAVESSPGAGTAFIIRLPQLVEDVEDVEPIAPRKDCTATGAVVLLVEDDDAVRRSIERMLAADGYDVVTAANGEEAIRVAKNTRMDLILTDVAMRGLNGRETAERIRQTDPDVPVLFMSGYTDDAVLRRGIGDRVTPFLQKPFGAEDLARAVGDALSTRG